MVLCLGVRVSVMFHLLFDCYTFVRLWLLNGIAIFVKKIPARLVVCSHCLLSICNFYLFPNSVLKARFAFD